MYDYTRAIYWSQQVLAGIVDLMVPSGLYGYTHGKIGLFFSENFERKFRHSFLISADSCSKNLSYQLTPSTPSN